MPAAIRTPDKTPALMQMAQNLDNVAQVHPVCKTPFEELKLPPNDALAHDSHSESISLRRTRVAQKPLSAVQTEESTRRTPESFLHTVLQYYHKRPDGQNEDANS